MEPEGARAACCGPRAACLAGIFRGLAGALQGLAGDSAGGAGRGSARVGFRPREHAVRKWQNGEKLCFCWILFVLFLYCCKILSHRRIKDRVSRLWTWDIDTGVAFWTTIMQPSQRARIVHLLALKKSSGIEKNRCRRVPTASAAMNSNHSNQAAWRGESSGSDAVTRCSANPGYAEHTVCPL